MNFIDLFAGAVGISIGLTKAGFKPLLAADFNKEVKLTHEKNFPDIPYIYGDLSNKDIKKEIKTTKSVLSKLIIFFDPAA